jgi:hypothetical protein
MSFTQLEGMRGVRMDGHTDNYIPAHCTLRPTADRIIVHPLDVTFSRTIQVIYRTQPVRGIILACGPGTYPIRYRYGDKDGKRVKVASIHTGKRRPIEVKPGDIVELGGTHDTADGGRRRGYSWESFYWGDRFVIWATERDVCGITGHESLPADLAEYLDQGRAAQRARLPGWELSGHARG